jgi:putative transposase
MLKGFRYRIYPNEEQKMFLESHFSSVRFVYNLALETKKIALASNRSLSRYDLQVQLKELKEECAWLKEINSQSLQVALKDLDSSYVSFFRGLKDGSLAQKKNNYIKNRLSKGLEINVDKLNNIVFICNHKIK